MSRGQSRRSFLITAAGAQAAWAAVQPGKLTFFNKAQAAVMDAVVAQIIPSDDGPGAREAHCLYFIDRALATLAKSSQPVYTEGIAALGNFAALSSERQIEALKAIEKTPFFRAVRTHTVIGFLSRPVHGGNYGKAGWKLIGYDDSLNHKPPFGYYDAL